MELIGQHHKHITKTGDTDKRYPNNLLYSTYLDIYMCTDEECKHIFQIEKHKKAKQIYYMKENYDNSRKAIYPLRGTK